MSEQTISRSDKASNVETFDAEAVNAKANRSLYAARKKIHPKRATGRFRQLKWWIMAITLGIYYLTPLLRWDRGPNAPDQAVLVDMANRRFYFFFIEIWPQEFFYVAGMLVMAGIGLFLVTSTVGRAWCGYTCPQTVWVDLYLVVERFFEGDRNARIKLDKQPWDFSKIRKKVSKHTLWVLIGVATGGAWIFYFADAPTLFVNLFTGQAPFIAYSTVAILTATTYIFGGLMREQVCTYMCPWPRIQAAMLDENSLTVTYNDWRGEPRSRHAKRMKAAGKPVGDCVDCNACVAVCPMGIDIRDGQQLECITCALCIDACDGVMDKIGVERGLISYATLAEYNANMEVSGARLVDRDGDSVFDISKIKPSNVRDGSGFVSAIKHTNLQSFIRPRTILYTAIYALIGIAMLVVLATRSRLEVNILPDRNPVFTVLSDGSIRNGYQVKILNMITDPRTFKIEINGLPGANAKLSGSDEDLGTSFDVDVEPDQLRNVKVFISVPRENLSTQRTDFEIMVTEVGGEETTTEAVRFEAPEDIGNEK
ncbi:MAG: cytochrome c oxidase accessory protein CcoG [Pseudomonadota bacterium]